MEIVKTFAFGLSVLAIVNSAVFQTLVSVYYYVLIHSSVCCHGRWFVFIKRLPVKRLCPSCRMFARRRTPSYWDYSMNCTGNEAHVSNCKLGHSVSIKGNSSCSQGMPVVVSCIPGRAFAPTPMAGYRKAFRQEVGHHTAAFSTESWLFTPIPPVQPKEANKTIVIDVFSLPCIFIASLVIFTASGPFLL